MRDNQARPPQDETTVHLGGGFPRAAADDGETVHLPDGFRRNGVPEGVTVAMAGAMLAPAPAAAATGLVRLDAAGPVFVDDSGGRKRLLRLVGVLVGVLAVGFLAVVGVALAVPSVATSVGLGDVMPFMVPGAAAAPPASTTTPAPTPVVTSKPVVATRTRPKPVVIRTTARAVHTRTTTATPPTPTTTPAPPTEPPVTEDPLGDAPPGVTDPAAPAVQN